DVFRLSRAAGGGSRRTRLPGQDQSGRGGRCVRGAAGVPDGAEQPSVFDARLEGHPAALLRHAVPGALHLGRDRGYPAEPVRTDLRRMIRPVLTELALFLAPFIAYALFLVVTRTAVLEAASWSPKLIASLAIVA